MTSGATGRKCLACGKASTLRCSACANTAGIDLFFCSKGHQKLVWPYHRLVCGERAHPFRLPVYSQEEADVLLERLREPAEKAKLRVLQEKMHAALEAHNAHESDLKQEKIQSLVGQEGTLAENCLPAPDPLARVIRKLRLLSWEWLSEMHDTGGDHPVEHFVEHMTSRYDNLTENAPPAALQSVWHSRLCHHLASPFSAQAQAVRLTRAVSGGRENPVPVEELPRLPGGLKAVLEVNAAYCAFSTFLRDAEGTEHAAFANVVRYNDNKPDPELYTGAS
ncbi:hypothetical protein JCM3774_003618 [Rhodotorula dairenensis]